ncbi:MAG: aminotransferase class I/II-fold pyridoxal phosphate-dependent enzyme [[Clostridium] spiroforme]|uniref:Aminotransferase n=1 Tax=Thomasclavelia spiroformis TaxID=29348 RepID=A0A943I6Y5_9FIRM|nr:aminotransferase class I/II-fold pyridoxal phosphate-dependent enzyme [Thomasclavelia spiroformis]MBS5588819.1 aminotransferase class I/II-fold pyridoxal phosphate-dependent enzyme [Thomasclavelia spiroformis]
MNFSKRMNLFSESIFTTLAKKTKQRKEAGLPVIDFSTGTPNIPPSKNIRETLSKASLDPKNYVYAINDLPELIDAVINWYQRRYNVNLNNDEICSLLGSQEGLSHLGMTLIDENDIVLVPNPSYPIFKDGPLIAGAKIVEMPLLKENDYLIDFSKIDKNIAKKAKFMVVSYPNNPTCGVANDEFYLNLIQFAKENEIIVLHDNAYSELLFETPGKSFLSYPGAKDVGIEFNSLSKTYGLAGARIGFALGNSEIIKQIKTLKSNIDYGMFIPIQLAAIEAITGDQSCVEQTRNAYKERRDAFLTNAKKIGWKIDKTKGTMFIWAKIPDKYKTSFDFVDDLFNQTGILFVPGNAFGSYGEGFVRIALIQDIQTIEKAFSLINKTNIFK